MSKCDLYLVFDDPNRTYHPGDEVVGVAKVVVNKDIKCDKVFLRTEWRTHGRGNRASGDRNDIVLAEGEPLYAGQEKMLPFRFTAPNGPLSYRGNLLNVDWYARLQVDVPWAIDPKLEEEFLLEQGDGDARELSMGDPRIIEAAKKFSSGKMRNGSQGCAVVIGFAFLLGGLYSLYMATLGQGGGDLKIGGLVAGSIFSLIGGALLVWTMMNKIALAKLGDVEVTVEPEGLRRGEAVQVRVACSPKDPSVISNISSVLSCREIVVSGSGTNQTTHTHQVFEDVQGQVSMGDGPAVRGSLAKQYTHTIPADAPLTFWADDNRLEWAIEVRISIKGWPDWKEKRLLVVRP